MTYTSPKRHRRAVAEILETAGPIAAFVRTRRKELGYTQTELAQRAGVSAQFIKELEGGKPTVRLSTVNQLLAFFGHELAPRPIGRRESGVDPTREKP